MSDPTEVEALKASFRGALATADALGALLAQIDGLDPHAPIAAADLEPLARASLAHAIASQALRGLVAAMLARREPRSPDAMKDGGTKDAPAE
jgi:hypothetical protein